MSMYTIICFLSLASCAWASCAAGRPTIKMTAYGTMLIYCEYRGIKLAAGTTLKTMDTCEECTCNPGGLHCCGYGSHGGVQPTPPGCKAVSDACQRKFVDANDVTKPCPGH